MHDLRSLDIEQARCLLQSLASVDLIHRAARRARPLAGSRVRVASVDHLARLGVTQAARTVVRGVEVERGERDEERADDVPQVGCDERSSMVRVPSLPICASWIRVREASAAHPDPRYTKHGDVLANVLSHSQLR